MKALSLWQPWATLVALGEKKIETRAWSTTYRGPLAIHAAKNFPSDARRLCGLEEPFKSTLLKARFNVTGPLKADFMPLGVIVAVCELVAIDSTNNILPQLRAWKKGRDYWDLTSQERAFGDYSADRFAWFLKDIRPLKTPVPCKGMQGLWAVPAHIVQQIKEAL